MNTPEEIAQAVLNNFGVAWEAYKQYMFVD